jgi:hypothetical protein
MVLRIMLFIMCAGFISCTDYPESRNPTMCNPIHIEYRFTDDKPSRRMAADPVIVLYNDAYYLFSTGSGEYWYSDDLVDWILIPEEVSELPDQSTAPAAAVINQPDL